MGVCTRLKTECFNMEGLEELQAELDSELQATALRLTQSSKANQHSPVHLGVNITTPAIKAEIMKESSRINSLCRDISELDKQQAALEGLEKKAGKGKLDNLLYSKTAKTVGVLGKAANPTAVADQAHPELGPSGVPKVFSAASASLLNMLSDQEDIKRGLEQYSQEHKSALLDVSKAIVASYKNMDLPDPEPEISAHYKSKLRKYSGSAVSTPTSKKLHLGTTTTPLISRNSGIQKEVEATMQRITESLTLAEEMAVDTPKADASKQEAQAGSFSKFAALKQPKAGPSPTKQLKPTVSSATKPVSSRK